MYRGVQVAAVVPAFNEADHVGQVIKGVPDYVDIIVVVDDCSADSTAAVATGLGDERVVVLRHSTNQGVGGAIVTGHLRAIELGSQVNVILAGDDQMDSQRIPELLDPLLDGGYGFAKANRFFSIDSFDGMPRHRILGNVLLSFATKFASGYWHLFDPQNGFTAIRTDILRRLPIARVSRRYSFENDLLIQLNILRIPAVDVPIPARYGHEVSGIKLRRVVPELIRLLVTGFWRRVIHKYVLWSFSPVALFLFTGLALTLAGLLMGTWTIAQTLGPPTATAGSVLLAVVPTLIGLQMLMYALLLDIQESPGSPTTWHDRLPALVDERSN